MPFVAIDRESGKRIDITAVINPRTALKAGEHVCQLCGQPMIIKAGLIVAAHFAHKATCPTDYKSHPESPEHRQGKILVARSLRENVSEYSTAAIEYEVPIPEVKRVADVLVTFPMGWRVAHEIQLASITTEELARRTEDYLHAGIDVVWWLGKSADTPANRAWCEGVLGFSLSLHLEASGAEYNHVSGPMDLQPLYAN